MTNHLANCARNTRPKQHPWSLPMHKHHTCSVTPLAVQSKLASVTSSFIASMIFFSKLPWVNRASNMATLFLRALDV